MTNFADFKAAIEGISGGKNTALLDKFGLPSVVVPINKMTYKDVGVGDDTVLPAFKLDGVEKPYFCIGKYHDTLVNGIPCSLPMQTPAVNVNFDEAVSQSRSKGEGWTLATNAMYAAIQLWCRANGFMPRGNNNYGSDHAHAWEKGTPANYDSNGKVNLTLTGSGPVSWNHNNDLSGICDLNGNAWEWAAGMRIVDGEIQIIQHNDAALATADLSSASSLWKAIAADGSLVAPGTVGTIKLDWRSSKWTLVTDTLTDQSDSGRGTGFASLATTLSTVPQILYGIGVYPKEPGGDYGGDDLYAINKGERLPIRGGSGYNTSYAGVFKLDLYHVRGTRHGDVGRRSAFVGSL
jgi:hypothetical protein